MARQARERSDELVLTDPKAYRVLAHGVRRQLLDVLGTEDQLTATQAAAQVGISPSAMSYHLRALEKWGIVERIEPTGDGREHPWRLAARSISFQTESAPRERRAFAAQHLDRLATAVDRGSVKGGDVRLIESAALLTPEELDELAGRLEEWLAPYEKRRRKGQPRVEGARAVQVFFAATSEPGAG
ncbi:helix-turn-helix domain-containing protein [Branchiibius sp. NY16-3462-2]|uniref:helix-turn-helix domain-containing protein n=1 Tax=Branchiibius sp. NY16-3462-2 TaxID=1807500 RepID=UPI000793104C|nr:helix-turn-helix domain-containing protein [Branchiibius sp. NY16-3462-2]KYH45191.1 hypothetical protein AZH51_15080 [Branchiibius sp. NY16-3462-2]